MSLLCSKGQKKKKGKGSRDRSPAYGSKGEEASGPSEENTKLIRQTERLKQLEEEKRHLEETLRDEKNKSRESKQEVANLKDQLHKLKKQHDSVKVAETPLGSVLPSAAEEEKKRLAELESAQKQIENERRKGEERVKQLSEDFERVSEELKKANKALETERNSGEAKVNNLSGELRQAKHEAEAEKRERTKAEEDRDKFKREKDAVENKLAHTNKELEIARRESHIPRSPTRAPSDEWKAKIEAAESELHKEREQRLEKERENSRLANDKDSLEKEKQALETEIQNLKSAKEKELADIKAMKDEEMESLKKNLEMNHKNDSQRMEDTIDKLRTSLRLTEAEKEKLLTRLSSQTAAQVLDNNPNVSDLSDPNRPQKLGELFAQIYDDQWTDATEALEKLEKNEEDILKTLLDILEVVYTHCKEAAENQLSRIEEDLFLPPLENSSFESPDTNGTEHLKSPTTSKHSLSKESDNHGTKDKDKPKRSLSFPKVKGEKMPEIPTEVKKGIKEYRKKVTKQVWPVIEKEVLSKLRKEFEGSVIEACKAYITKCVELCWLMRVQDPPVVLSWKVPDDKTFNTDVYRAYTKNGSHVEYVVWPIMYLHEDGPILMKGVAQGIKL